jgi:hypothetical protein
MPAETRSQRCYLWMVTDAGPAEKRTPPANGQINTQFYSLDASGFRFQLNTLRFAL